MNPKFFSAAILFAVAVCTITNDCYAQKKKEKPALDGKKFTVQTMEVKAAGKPSKAIDDELVFKSKKVQSDVVSDKTKFGSISYTITSDTTYTDTDGDEVHAISFEATGTGDEGDDLKWTGTVNNFDIEGNVVWSKNGKVRKEYNFSNSGINLTKLSSPLCGPR